MKDTTPNVRITLIDPSPYDDVTRPPVFDGGYNSDLLKYGEYLRTLAERDASAGELALTALGDATFGDSQTQFNAAFGRALLARMMKDENKARSAFAAIRPQQEQIVRASPDFGPALCILAGRSFVLASH